MAKIYTKSGDKGKSSLVGGTRVDKYDQRLNAYGEVDELNSVIGILRSSVKQELPDQDAILHEVQSSLFVIGSHLACEIDKRETYKLPTLDESFVTKLENNIDAFEASLPELKNFILPAGSESSSRAHLARTVCRRVERSVIETRDLTEIEEGFIVFLNRLSDYFFSLARKLNDVAGVEEVVWKP